MKKKLINSNLFGNILSDGSFCFLYISNSYLKHSMNYRNLDTLNHPVWTGKRPEKQTEISAFVNRLVKNKY
ncbi:unnamed protein product [Ectocarpus sp. 4 AP-2014]